jgi:hypothetical protein
MLLLIIKTPIIIDLLLEEITSAITRLKFRAYLVKSASLFKIPNISIIYM